MHIPYTHSGVMASAMAMDKVTAKRVVAAAGVTSPQGVVVRRAELRAKASPPARPYVIKPINEGSSVGVRIVREGDNRLAVDDTAWEFGEEVLIEPFIPGRELTVSVMGDRALGGHRHPGQEPASTTTRPSTPMAGRSHVIPAEIGPEATQAALDAALAAHQALGCRGVSRSDFRYDDTQIENGGAMGELYWLEVNTQPGMTPLSLVPEQAAHLGISFPEICAWMVEKRGMRLLTPLAWWQGDAPQPKTRPKTGPKARRTPVQKAWRPEAQTRHARNADSRWLWQRGGIVLAAGLVFGRHGLAVVQRLDSTQPGTGRSWPCSRPPRTPGSNSTTSWLKAENVPSAA